MAHDLDAPIWDFAVPPGIHRVIRRMRVYTVRQLSECSDADILRVQGCGAVTVAKVEAWLAGFGVGLAEATPEKGDG